MKALLTALTAAITASGCATIASGTTQDVTVRAEVAGRPTAATCTLTNDYGKTTSDAKGFAQVHRSSKQLTIVCTDNKSLAIGSITAESHVRAGAMVANVITDFCVVSCIVDFASGAVYAYPSEFRVPMQ